jgi:hypothetical protein
MSIVPPEGMSGNALRVEFPKISGRGDTVVVAQKPATSVSFRYSTPIDLTFVYEANGNPAQTAPLPAGTRKFRMKDMSSASTTITTEATANHPATFWLDDILFE